MPALADQPWTHSVLEFATTGFATRNVRGTFVDRDPASCHLLGYTRDEPVGKSYQSVTSAEIETRHRIIEAVESVEAANQSKSLFLANLSHEFRTPMNEVLGIAQLLPDTELDSKQRDDVGRIQSAGRSLLQILNDTLALRPDSELTLPLLALTAGVREGVVPRPIEKDVLFQNLKALVEFP